MDASTPLDYPVAVRRILVPTDFSDCAQGALRQALTLAECYDAEVHLLHVVTLHQPEASGDAPSEERGAHQGEGATRYRERTEEVLQDVLADQQHSGVSVVTVVRKSMAIAPALVAYVNEATIDLVVVGTHGRRGVKQWMLGSVAEEVMREAPCPVLLVRARKGKTVAAPVRRILVPVDFSVPSRQALAYAVDWAERFGAALQLMHVVEPLPFPVSLTGVLTIHDLVPDITTRTRRHLRDLLDTVRTDGLEASVHVEEGYPAAAITRAAQDDGVDLIVIASRGLAGLERLFVGSVTTRVVRAAPCPVLVVRDDEAAPEAREDVAADQAVPSE